jgi:hypothetical protein
MLEVKLPIGLSDRVESATLPNSELIRGILAMPPEEYKEVIAGILLQSRMNNDNLLLIFAHVGNYLQKSELLPGQRNALMTYLKDFKI